MRHWTQERTGWVIPRWNTSGVLVYVPTWRGGPPFSLYHQNDNERRVPDEETAKRVGQALVYHDDRRN